jgi:mRNA-degrading endonuclease RelE of RelBE toxin-antitoxin system
MTFKILIHKNAFSSVPDERKLQIKEAIKELINPLPGGNKQEIKGKSNVYRLRVGKYRIIYIIDFDSNEVLITEIITAEQAHKKYGR